jgi:hypothetical protein
MRTKNYEHLINSILHVQILICKRESFNLNSV